MFDPVNRQVIFGDGYKAHVDLFSPVVRHPDNPVLTPHHVNARWSDPALQVVTVHNAGVTRHNDTVLMLFRSHLRCGKSVLGVARSSNGIDGWNVHPSPVLKPATLNDLFAPDADKAALIENESGGIEDPRITRFGNRYAITYSAYHGEIKNRVRVSLAVTEDFLSFRRYGPLLERDMRNVVLFPQPFGDRYAGLFRPNDSTTGDVGGIYTQIHLGYSSDWRCGPWEIDDQPIIKTGNGPSPFSDKIGPGAPPIQTDAGWLNIFHGVRTTMDGHPYVLGVALHDLDNPASVHVSSIPLLFPTSADCRIHEQDYIHVPNVVFTCGVLSGNDGALFIYYGGNDTVMNVAGTHVDVLIALCKRYGQNPTKAKLLYNL
jgi:predicted GH43/DUF377 family glycosyl hydrolase